MFRNILGIAIVFIPMFLIDLVTQSNFFGLTLIQIAIMAVFAWVIMMFLPRITGKMAGKHQAWYAVTTAVAMFLVWLLLMFLGVGFNGFVAYVVAHITGAFILGWEELRNSEPKRRAA
jgi:hypothetical protein